MTGTALLLWIVSNLNLELICSLELTSGSARPQFDLTVAEVTLFRMSTASR
jgi:hypothetical protein